MLRVSGPPWLNRSSSLTTVTLPLAAAMCAQVAPVMLASMANSGRCLRNSFTTSEWSFSAARWSGVWPRWNKHMSHDGRITVIIVRILLTTKTLEKQDWGNSRSNILLKNESIVLEYILNTLLHLYIALFWVLKVLYIVRREISTTTSVQHAPGWRDSSHSVPERPPHTSYRWRGDRVMKSISAWGWLGGHDGQRLMGKFVQDTGVTPYSLREVPWDF